MPKRTTQPKAAAAPRDAAGRVIDAALDLAAARPWHTVSLADIGAAAGLSLAEVYRLFPSKAAIVAGFMSEADAAVLATSASGDSVRDRLFDVIMRRFDAFAPRKAALRSILRDAPRDPLGALCAAPRFLRSMTWLAEAAGVDTAAPLGMLKVKGVAGVYLVALGAWLGDESDDHAKTMAALDRALKRVEALAQGIPGLRRRQAS